MNNTEIVEIQKLQRNLQSFRKLAGWTAEDLGDRVGVTKQTISNLETGRTNMSKMQYIAFRTVFDYESQSNDILAKALHLVLDERDISQNDQKDNEDKVKTVAAATAAGVKGSALSKLLGVVASVALGAWLANFLDKDDTPGGRYEQSIQKTEAYKTR